MKLIACSSIVEQVVDVLVGDLGERRIRSRLVRLRVKKASEELNHIFEALLKKVQEPGADSPFAEITDEDIDNLFND